MSHLRNARPGQLIVAAFLTTIVVGTVLLMLPLARTGAPAWVLADGSASGLPATIPVSIGSGAPLSVALFTATSASSVTGLIVVDTATYWSPFGQVVLLCLMQLGGLGTMTIAALVAILVARRLGLAQRSWAAASTGDLHLGDVRDVVVRIVRWALIAELAAAFVLFVRFLFLGYDTPRAAGHALFLAISAFNNAGFSPYADSLMAFSGDPLVILPISALIITGGLGFPVLRELRTRVLPSRRWSMNTKLVVLGTCAFIVAGWLAIALAEWNNPDTLGPLSLPHRLLAAFFTAISPRTAGFNSIDIATQYDVTWVMTDMLMFVGAGPAGTAGGIKITTALVLLYIVWTEVSGERSVEILGRRLDRAVHRQAITVITLSAIAVLTVTFAIMIRTAFGLDRALFEAVSAFATVGLSTGITPHLPVSIQLVLAALMFIGRMGPLTIATALALRKRTRLYEYPKERPLIG
ncbi:MAG: potassium transporter TrkG [Bowdeniella nasicola]|nr:potassium transporter TrkG [Bowdeniella nasicola]